MEILVKRNGNLKKLGEGKIYSKKDLTLNEENELTLTTNDGLGKESPSEIKHEITQEAPHVPGETNVLVTPNSVKGVTPPSQSQVNKPGSRNVDINSSNFEGEIEKNAKEGAESLVHTSTNESNLHKMRKNSIPFTKSELHDFLKTI